jgi:hypothetical protein
MLIYREKPNVAITFEKGAYTATDTFDLNQNGFKVAFGAIDYLTGEVLKDPQRVEWVVTLDEYKNLQIINSKKVSYHYCTEEDYNSFFEVVPQDAAFAKQLKESNALYCFDSG